MYTIYCQNHKNAVDSTIRCAKKYREFGQFLDVRAIKQIFPNIVIPLVRVINLYLILIETICVARSQWPIFERLFNQTRTTVMQVSIAISSRCRGLTINGK
jgi:hypothetical protein